MLLLLLLLPLKLLHVPRMVNAAVSVIFLDILVALHVIAVAVVVVIVAVALHVVAVAVAVVVVIVAVAVAATLATAVVAAVADQLPARVPPLGDAGVHVAVPPLRTRREQHHPGLPEHGRPRLPLRVLLPGRAGTAVRKGERGNEEESDKL